MLGGRGGEAAADADSPLETPQLGVFELDGTAVLEESVASSIFVPFTAVVPVAVHVRLRVSADFRFGPECRALPCIAHRIPRVVALTQSASHPQPRRPLLHHPAAARTAVATASDRASTPAPPAPAPRPADQWPERDGFPARTADGPVLPQPPAVVGTTATAHECHLRPQPASSIPAPRARQQDDVRRAEQEGDQAEDQDRLSDVSKATDKGMEAIASTRCAVASMAHSMLSLHLMK